MMESARPLYQQMRTSAYSHGGKHMQGCLSRSLDAVVAVGVVCGLGWVAGGTRRVDGSRWVRMGLKMGWAGGVVKGGAGCSAVDSLSDALSAGVETRCVGCWTVAGAPECVSRFTP